MTELLKPTTIKPLFPASSVAVLSFPTPLNTTSRLARKAFSDRKPPTLDSPDPGRSQSQNPLKRPNAPIVTESSTPAPLKFTNEAALNSAPLRKSDRRQRPWIESKNRQQFRFRIKSQWRCWLWEKNAIFAKISFLQSWLMFIYQIARESFKNSKLQNLIMRECLCLRVQREENRWKHQALIQLQSHLNIH